jgi:hypothetical protein
VSTGALRERGAGAAAVRSVGYVAGGVGAKAIAPAPWTAVRNTPPKGSEG